MSEPRIRFKKVEAGEYSALDAETGETIGHVVKTGTHLDDYPWDWSVDERVAGALREAGVRRFGGAGDTLRSCKEEIRYAYSHIGEPTGKSEQ